MPLKNQALATLMPLFGAGTLAISV